jgi:hypothetical protein
MIFHYQKIHLDNHNLGNMFYRLIMIVILDCTNNHPQGSLSNRYHSQDSGSLRSK